MVALVSFPWLATPPRPRRRATDAENRAAMYRDELVQRAGLYYRLGYPPSRAISRLKANVAWDFEVGAGERPSGLGDKEIGEIVKTTYLRRPAR
jgi:hypothetical protein